MRPAAAHLVATVLLALAACNRDHAPAPVSSTSSATTSTPAASATPSLARGDKAPDFSLVGSDGKTHTLAEHAGKEVVVLAWFPKAFTGG